MTTGLGLVVHGLGLGLSLRVMALALKVVALALGVVALLTSLYITTSHAIRSAETWLDVYEFVSRMVLRRGWMSVSL